MNEIFKYCSIIFLFLVVVSCETEEDTSMDENSEISIIKNEKGIVLTKGSGCPISFDNPNPVSFIGETRTFTVSSTISPNAIIQWSIESGVGMQIIGSSTNNSVTVQFNQGFRGGTVNVFVNNSGGLIDCDQDLIIYTVGGGEICPSGPPTPQPIYSEFMTPVPPEYVTGNLGSNYICTTTINNELSVPFETCVNYSWSITPITPSGENIAFIYPTLNKAIVGVKKTGRYRVILVTSNSNGQRIEQFILIAENCNGIGIGF